jgi:alkylation response protein AidB-like acyl-CoA dehydrogenase
VVCKHGAMTNAGVIGTARQVAQDVLYPAAMAVDAAAAVPPGHLDELAAAGLYGLAAPAGYGGSDVDLVTFCRVVEILAGGCLTTTFVWLQHRGAVRALAASGNEQLREAWLKSLATGQRRAGNALAGAWPGPPLVRARRVDGGYVFDGKAPWVSGWGLVDVIYALARDEEDRVVAALIPAQVSPALTAQRLDLVAVNASVTVELSFAGYMVPDELVCGVVPHADWLARDAQGLRPNGSLALGVASRCCELMGAEPFVAEPFVAEPFDAELARLRERLDAAGPAQLPAARAAAAEFAFRAAGTMLTGRGSRGILTSEHPQRLAREALFLLVFGSRPAIKESLIGLLARSPAG